MQNQTVAEIIVYLGYTVYRNKESTTDTEIFIGVQHIIQFIHSVVNNKFAVIKSFKKVQPSIAEEISYFFYVYRNQFLSVLYKEAFPVIFGLQFLLQLFYQCINAYGGRFLTSCVHLFHFPVLFQCRLQIF